MRKCRKIPVLAYWHSTRTREGVRKMAKNAVDTVRRDTSAVAAGAADHPHTATGLLLGIGALAFMAGFVFSRGAADHTSYWR